MSTRTDNYNLIICDGTDVVNPLTQIFPNFSDLDDILRNIANTGITTATELVTGTVHALTRSDANVSVFRFQATSNFTSGETFTVDGAQVTALDVSGETLKTGAYIVGSMVLCELRDTLLTVYVSGGSDADTLEGHPASYFATATGLSTVDGKANANKILIDGIEDELTPTVTTPYTGITHSYYGHVEIVDVNDVWFTGGDNVAATFGITNRLPISSFWTQVEVAGGTPIMALLDTSGNIRFMDLALANTVAGATIHGHFVFISRS